MYALCACFINHCCYVFRVPTTSFKPSFRSFVCLLKVTSKLLLFASSVLCVCVRVVWGRSSPRRSSDHAELSAPEPAGYERYERDEPDLYADQYAPYPR